MKVISLIKNGKRVDITEEMFKARTEAAREASAQVRHKDYSPDQHDSMANHLKRIGYNKEHVDFLRDNNKKHLSWLAHSKGWAMTPEIATVGKVIGVEKTWTQEAHEAAIEARKKGAVKRLQEIMSLPSDRRFDYWEHRRAGTPHEFAVGLAERRGGS
jgi:hypothetical protein